MAPRASYKFPQMDKNLKYSFSLPPEEEVIQRNRTITTYYAQLYQNNPQLFKWAGMAAFASFHVGEKMKMWDWEDSGIKSLASTCGKKNRTLEDDFQIIRIINNRIFAEIGSLHLAFAQMDFQSFTALLLREKKHPLVIQAFESLNTAKELLKTESLTSATTELIWEANTKILWHEQSEVVQPMFNRLSEVFSQAMTLFASFDYKVNHHRTQKRTRSRFVLYMLFSGFSLLRKNWSIPKITNLEHRWCWISNSLLTKWRSVEATDEFVAAEIEFIASMEDRQLKL